jgi:GNAT superfamily N-acetyltransferase
MSPSPSPSPSPSLAALHDRRRSHEINRYPTTLIDVWQPRPGTRFTIRPILPQDEVPLGRMFARLSAETVYNRFHSPLRGVPPALLRRMTRVDYRRELALVVTTLEAEREIVVADARYVVEEESEAAEFAIVVEDRWQRGGLGKRAMHALADAARRVGLLRLSGLVLRSNTPMLALVRHCRYACRADPDARLVHVEHTLHASLSPQAA